MTRRIFGFVALVTAALLLIRFWPHPPLASYAPSSTAVLAADGSLLRLTLAADEQYRLWVPLKQMSPALIGAVKLQEDQWFYWHIGVNPLALLRGAWQTYSGANRQGGSTLTMQLARLVYGLNTRSPIGKIKQAALAFWLEVRYSKHDILEAYLNLAPYGRNIQGVGAASLIYFGKTADKLTMPEALTLAVIPQRPKHRASQTSSLDQARLRLFARWKASHPASKADENLAHVVVPLRSLNQLPFAAPHFVDQVLADTQDFSPIQSRTIQTTLQPRLQALLQRQVKQYVSQNGARGIRNAVAMLVDTRSQQVVALQGSADFANAAINGQVNGTQGKRSPGSTLKPFIYGMALDQGLIHPLSILKDAPTAFGPFQPENFDGRFVGPVTARDALIRSRNIPAVYLASKLKQPSLYDFMKNAGITKLQSEDHYGLALVLGGGEVTMEELATLYTMLANQGQLKPLRYLANDEATKSVRGMQLLSPEASYLVLDMLAANPRPDGIPAANGRSWTTMWKTGTSWGFRDAWTVGVTGPYVLAVWIGNFDGSSNPAFVGIEAAAPLFFRIADALPITMPTEREPVRLPPRSLPPRSLKHVSVCAASGDLPNAWCPQLESTWFIPGKSPIKVSTLHRPVMINNLTGQAACPPYDASSTHQEIFEFWPSDMMRLFREAGMPRRAPPVAHCGGDTQTSEGDVPHITSPLTSVSYTLRLSRPDETIALQATASGDARLLYWFSDKDYLGNVASNSGGKAWRPATSGWHSLTVVDDKGRSASRDIRIEILP
ncbi:MAG TPA: penicillin-binding protein 1C [Methylophilaceae bacterium]|nr:penicillin-binding protein 1C [Methylophilaceae bacterium]